MLEGGSRGHIVDQDSAVRSLIVKLDHAAVLLLPGRVPKLGSDGAFIIPQWHNFRSKLHAYGWRRNLRDLARRVSL